MCFGQSSFFLLSIRDLISSGLAASSIISFITGKYTFSLKSSTVTSISFSSSNELKSTKLFPTTLRVLSSSYSSFLITSTVTIPAFSIALAVSSSITSPADTKTSPVSGSITSSLDTSPSILSARASLRLYLYLPTLARSYLLSSKRRLLIKFVADSTLAGSPGFNFL